MPRGKPGNLDNLSLYFKKDKDFMLTQDEYEKITDGVLSTDLSYVKNRSALSRKAKENGFVLEIVPADVKPVKLYFKKKI